MEVQKRTVLLVFAGRDGDEVSVDVRDLARLCDGPARDVLLGWCAERCREAALAGLQTSHET
jgi:hypothetical protein